MNIIPHSNTNRSSSGNGDDHLVMIDESEYNRDTDNINLFGTKHGHATHFPHFPVIIQVLVTYTNTANLQQIF